MTPRIRSPKRGLRQPACLMLAITLLAPQAAAAFEVFACEPEWAALVRVLKPDANIRTATHARQDPHHIEARPSLIAALRRADLAVCTGVSLEAGWLPMLQRRASNPKVQDGKPGLFYAAQHVRLIDPHQGTITPFDGDVHPEGNPHLHLDPQRLATVARALNQRLQQLLPAEAEAIGQRHDTWQARWQAHLVRWEAQRTALQGMPIVVQHGTFSYLWRWLGIQPIADLEPKPGLPPTPGHLQQTLSQTRHQAPAAIVTALYQDTRPSAWLSQQLPQHPPVLHLPASPTDGDDSEAPNLSQLFQTLLDSLMAAHQRPKPSVGQATGDHRD
ncbi:MAG: zinc ABC transporter substrate-binding protein [Lautropia sp.]|nr:zinc ABC transporter substrate-binding protein [Lautropia sp.]